MPPRELREEVSCPIWGHVEWVGLNEAGAIRLTGLDRQDWFPIDTDVFVCKKCGFLRFHWTDQPSEEVH